MSKDNDDGVIVDIDPRQLDLTLDPETERRAKPKDEPAARDAKPAAEDDIKGGNDDAIEALQRQLDALKAENERERTARVAKEREAAEARAQAQQTYGYAQQRDYDLVNTNINNAKSRAEAIKREMKIARETGNTDLESDLMIENARLGASLEREETRKREIEETYRREQAKREREAKQPAADPFEAMLQNVSPKSAAWLRQHPECMSDDVMNAKVLLADKEARRKGFAADTPEYFQYIEETMGYRKPQRNEDDASDEADTRRTEKNDRRGSYAAPVSRDAAAGSGLKPTQKRLSREQVETAEALGMTPAAYATWLAKAERDQKYINH